MTLPSDITTGLRAYLPYKSQISFYGCWISPYNWCFPIKKYGYDEFILRWVGFAVPPDQVLEWPTLSICAFAENWWKIDYRQSITHYVGKFNLDDTAKHYVTFIATRTTWLLSEGRKYMLGRVVASAGLWNKSINNIIWRLWVATIIPIPHTSFHGIKFRQFTEIRGGLNQLRNGVQHLITYLEQGDIVS